MNWSLIDHIDVFEPWSYMRGYKEITIGDTDPDGVFGRNGLPENFVIEGAIQMGHWLVMISTDFAKTAQLTGLRDFGFGARPVVGDKLQIKVHVNSHEWDDIQLECDISTNRHFIARGKFTLETIDIADPEETDLERFKWYELTS